MGRWTSALQPGCPGGTYVDVLSADERSVTEGGVMLSRSYGSVARVGRTVTQLSRQFGLILAPKQARVAKKPKKKSKPKSR